MNTLTVGIARTPEEARQCFALRYAAHVTDGKRSHYLDHRAREVRDELDEIATIHTVSDGDRIIATMRSIWGGDALPQRYRDWFDLDDFRELDRREIAFTSRLIIDPAYRKSGALTMMLVDAYPHVRRKGVTVVFMHTSPKLIGMYERLGVQRFRDGVIDTDAGCDVMMLLTADAHDWLASIRSPFSLATGGFPCNNARRDWFAAKFPEHAAGTTPHLLGAAGFADRLRQLGASDVLEQLRSDPERLSHTALFVSRAGDIVARSRDNFRSSLFQVSGASELRSTDGTVERFTGRADVDAFVTSRQAGDCELISTERSVWLCMPPERAKAERPQTVVAESCP